MTTALKQNVPKLIPLDPLPQDPQDDLLNSWVQKFSSGNLLKVNNTKGRESISIQHRSGSLLEMQPDGSVRLVSQNGKMGIEVNGEGYMRVTGLYNLIVDGDAGFKIAGNADWHVGGDMKVTVSGTYSLAANEMTVKIKDKLEIAAQHVSVLSADNAIFTAGTKMAIWSGSDMLVQSNDVLTLIGSTKIDLNP